MSFENNEDYISGELEKHKRKLREIGRLLEQQHQLLRLIVRKMEIKTEADDLDESITTHDVRSSGGVSNGTISRWTSPRLRSKLRAALSFNKSI